MPPRTTSKDRAREVADRYFTIGSADEPESDEADGDGFALPPVDKPADRRSKAAQIADRYVPEPHPEDMPLSEKEWRFVEEYCVDWNGAQAAIRAGYAENSARRTAHRLTTKANIAAQIQKRRQELEAKSTVTSLTILERLHSEILADTADLFDKETGALKPMHEWPLIFRRGLVAGFKVKVLKDDDGNTIGDMVEIKLSDRTKRIELLGRHHLVGAFKDPVKGEADDGDALSQNLREQLKDTGLKPAALIDGTARRVP